VLFYKSEEKAFLIKNPNLLQAWIFAFYIYEGRKMNFFCFFYEKRCYEYSYVRKAERVTEK